MRIGGFQKFSLIDYPGKVAAVIFTQGCNFRCPFCHNAELVCPELFHDSIPEDDVIQFLQKRRDKLQGVVITGGEPTLQKDLIAFLNRIKQMGYLVKLDTNGSNPDVLQQLLDLHFINYVAMDIKSSFERYERAAGVKVNVDNIRRSIRILLDSDVQHEFRTTAVKSVCNSDDLTAIDDLIQGAEHYRLQRFVATDKLLDPNILSQDDFNDEEFSLLQSYLQR